MKISVDKKKKNQSVMSSSVLMREFILQSVVYAFVFTKSCNLLTKNFFS